MNNKTKIAAYNFKAMEQRIAKLEKFRKASEHTLISLNQIEPDYASLHEDLMEMAAHYVKEAIDQKSLNCDLDALKREAEISEHGEPNLAKLIINALQD